MCTLHQRYHCMPLLRGLILVCIDIIQSKHRKFCQFIARVMGVRSNSRCATGYTADLFKSVTNKLQLQLYKHRPGFSRIFKEMRYKSGLMRQKNPIIVLPELRDLATIITRALL